MKKIWIDLENTPHVPFFRPIIEELNRRGFEVNITARDAYQVYELADYFKMDYQRIGRHYGKNLMMKILGSVIRAVQLVPVIMKEKPDLAVSHGSRTQLLAASMLGIPSLMIYDYEHSKPLFLIRPTWRMVPEVIPDSALGPDRSSIFKYPGIKEDVYVPGFSPDPAIREELGVLPESLLVTIRPPATEAHYYHQESQELFEATIQYLSQKPNVQMVVLPRNKRQEAAIQEACKGLLDNRKIIIPDHAIDGLNLIWFSDLVISGGGTMNREAAALGVPVYSIFRSTIGAVDRYLAECNRLVLLESPADLPTKLKLARRERDLKSLGKKNECLEQIVERIMTATGARQA
jgi:uncharacterized protein